MPILKLKELDNLVNRLKTRLPNNLPNKCIIIGSSISVKSGVYGEYIDNADALVVRINTLPKSEYFKYYGQRTDLMISWDEEFLNTLDIPTYRLMLKDCAKEILSCLNVQIRITTGFAAIMILANLFNEIELFGFGFTKKQWSDNLFHYIDGTVYKGLHSLDIEDAYINHFQQHFNIYRGEEKHVELHCCDTSEV